MHSKHVKKPGELIFSILLLLLSIGFAWQAYQISGFSGLSTPGAFPLAAAIIMVFASIIVVISDLRRGHAVEGNLKAKWRAFITEVVPTPVSVFFALVLVYALLFDSLGFLPSSLIFLVLAKQYLHRAHAFKTIALSFLSLLVIWVIFRLVFSVVLPEGIVPVREFLAFFQHMFK